MKMKPRITVITPSFNQGQFIEDTIRSVANQTYDNVEYLIIDGGSSDETAAVVEKYRSVVTNFVSEPDRGQAHAINKGITLSTGDVLCWVNSDDLLEPNALSIVADIVRKRGGHFIYGDGWVVYEAYGVRRRVRPGPMLRERLVVKNFLQQPSTFWSRELISAVGGLDETLHYVLDWDFFIRVAGQFSMDYYPIPFSTYRVHPAHKSSSGAGARSLEILSIVHRYAPPHWQAAFRDMSAQLEPADGKSKVLKTVRGSIAILTSPRLFWRHGARAWTAMRVLT